MTKFNIQNSLICLSWIRSQFHSILIVTFYRWSVQKHAACSWLALRNHCCVPSLSSPYAQPPPMHQAPQAPPPQLYQPMPQQYQQPPTQPFPPTQQSSIQIPMACAPPPKVVSTACIYPSQPGEGAQAEGATVT